MNTKAKSQTTLFIARSALIVLLLFLLVMPMAQLSVTLAQSGKLQTSFGATRSSSVADQSLAPRSKNLPGMEARPNTLPESSIKPNRTQVEEAYGKLPLQFEANLGQLDTSVKFISRNSGLSAFLLKSAEAVMQLRVADCGLRNQKLVGASAKPENPQSNTGNLKSAVVRMKLSGANTAPTVQALDPLPGTVNYFIGNDAAQWRTDVPTFGKIKYEEVYPGIDLVFHGDRRQLEYDLVVAPQADPSRIKLSFSGTRRLRIDAKGDLVFGSVAGELRLRKPVVYQEKNGVKRLVRSRYVLKGRQQVGFYIAKYNRNQPLVIDPVFVYSTYLGGNFNDFGFGVTVDSSGSAYVTGKTNSMNFPVANPLQPALGGDSDVFITKFTPAGNTLVYSTYLGGLGDDEGRGVAVDSAGAAYVTGGTTGTDFPLVNPLQSSPTNAFVTKINAAGNALVYSTYHGGTTGQNKCFGIAVDSSGSAYVTGRTLANDFPTVNPFQATRGSDYDAFLSKFNPAGSALVYSTYLGGNGNDEGYGVAVDSSGNAYVTGRVFSTNFPTADPFQPSRGDVGFGDAFVTKFNAAGNTLGYSTYLGGGLTDEGDAIAVNSSGNAYVTGFTGSGNFPVANAFQSTIGNANVSDSDAFVTKLSAAGNTLVYSTYLGGADRDFGAGVAVDSSGSAYVTGRTLSTNFPLQNPLSGTAAGNLRSAFLTKFNPSGQTLNYSSYLGAPNGISEGYAVAVDATSNAYVTGIAQTADFPTVNAFQATFGGIIDAFVSKIGATAVPPGPGTPFISPNKGGDTGVVSVNLGFSNATAFQQGATVKLWRAGQPDIVGNPVGLSQQRLTLSALLDLRGAARGKWDVVVTNPDNTTIRLVDGFTIEQGRAPELWAEVIGRDRIRAARQQIYTVAFGNRGNVDAFAPVLLISFPKYLTFTREFEFTDPPQPPNEPPIDFSEDALTVEVGDQLVVPVIVQRLRANTPQFIHFSLETPDDPLLLGTRFNISATMEPPLVELASASRNLKRAAAAPGCPEGYIFSLSKSCLEQEVSTTNFPNANEFCLSSVRRELLASLKDICPQDFAATALFLGFGPGLARSVVKYCRCSNDCGVLRKRREEQIFAAVYACYKTEPCTRSSSRLAALTAQDAAPLTECKLVQIVRSDDPNDKSGAQGAGTPHFVPGDRPLPYIVHFENLETATAPAQRVLITDQLDASKYDLSTFNLSRIAFADKVVEPPFQQTQFTTFVDLRPDTDLLVRITYALNVNTGLLTVEYQSLDPVTGQPPKDPSIGFLPPNITPPEGEGSIEFSLLPKANLATGTEIRNRARIIFDNNAPIDTADWLNTIDASRPVSRVLPLAAQQSANNFQVSWSGTDTDSGIHDFTIFVSTNGGAFTKWLTTSDTAAIFNGQPGTTYGFYSEAQDNAGNLEPAKTSAEATTTTPAAVPCTITCPSGITAMTQTPGAACVSVTYPVPETSADCSSVSCSPASGSCFPRGVTTVNCTATEGSSSVTCSFTVTVFDACLQDDTNSATTILFNTASGEYRFCCGGAAFTGRGTVTKKGQTYTLQHNTTGRRVLATLDASVGRGTASLQSPPGSTRCSIADRDTRNNTCSCR